MDLIPHDPSKPEPSDAPIMRGVVGSRALVDTDRTGELRIYLVHFDAGSRNVFHTHDFDQVLFILDGEGIVANRQGEHRVSAGDVAVIPAGEQHWHGATEKSAMSHLAIGRPGVSVIADQA